MAWTTPRTYVTGEVVTATVLNTDIRDNLNYLKTYAAHVQGGSLGGQSGTGGGSVTFPVAFAATPVVILGSTTISGTLGISAVSATGFSWTAATWASIGGYNLYWIAYLDA